jgi:protein O-GlcNAc transferase
MQHNRKALQRQRAINDSFRLALEKHQQGFLDQAAQLDLKVLSREPEHADALHLLGVVAHQQGRHAQAIGLIRQALALKPGVAMYHAKLAEPVAPPFA